MNQQQNYNGEIAIFDIDGTLADISHRRHHVMKRPRDWTSFFQGMSADQAITPIVRMCNILYGGGVKIILCSGRFERHRADTEAWLANHQVNYHDLRLRADDDKRMDAVVKLEMIRDLDRSKILFIVEDRNQVVDMWREEGLVCLQCAPGDF